MDSPFIFSKYVTGKHNIGRKNEGVILGNLLRAGENVVMYEPPKTGISSMLQQTFYNMRIAGGQFEIAEITMLNVRDLQTFLIKTGEAAIRLFASTAEEFAGLAAKYLGGTHFIFDPEAFSSHERILSLNWDIDSQDIDAILTLPYRIAEGEGKRIYMIISEFQDLMLFPEGDGIIRRAEEVMKAVTPEQKAACTFIFTGSRVNAMKDIFRYHGRFHRVVEHVPLPPIDTKDIIDYTVRGFLTSGKVIERDLMLGVCKLFRNNIGYINHFSSICDSLSKGYIMEPVLIEALSMLLSIHEPKFAATMEDLTTFQVNLLKAIIEGNTRFSSAEVIRQYGLNSSANVRRLKDALCKKEIITFDDKDEPVVLDPLFQYWVQKYYFEIKDTNDR
ncbi:MAG: hypothetical protein K6C31_01340 [Bacteroidales bacterium]|nr:hypothetical protein [Bacteroidales bacterium]